jgi:hypothetical protein
LVALHDVWRDSGARLRGRSSLLELFSADQGRPGDRGLSDRVFAAAPFRCSGMRGLRTRTSQQAVGVIERAKEPLH